MEFGIGNAEFGMQKIKAKIIANRAQHKEKLKVEDPPFFWMAES
jgi:hypothetical protein